MNLMILIEKPTDFPYRYYNNMFIFIHMIKMIKNFLPPKLKYGSSQCFSPGSGAILSGAAPMTISSFSLPTGRQVWRHSIMNLIYQKIKEMKRHRTRRSCAVLENISALSLLLRNRILDDLDALGYCDNDIEDTVAINIADSNSDTSLPLGSRRGDYSVVSELATANILEVFDALRNGRNQIKVTIVVHVGECNSDTSLPLESCRKPSSLGICRRFFLLRTGTVVVAPGDEEQKSEKRDQKHCLSNFHQNLLLLDLGMCYRATMTRFVYCLEYSIFSARSQAQTKNQHFCCFGGLILMDSWIEKFSSPKIKIWFEPMFLTGSFAVFSGAAPPPFRPPAGGFARGLPRRRRRRKQSGLIQVFCTTLEKSMPRPARGGGRRHLKLCLLPCAARGAG